MKEVTDPNLLAQLNAGAPAPVGGAEVTNPNLLAQLNAPIGQPAPQEVGFFGKIQEQMRQRGANLADIAAAAGRQLPQETAVQTLGTELGALGDVIGQTISSAVGTGYEALPKGAQETIGELGTDILESDIGKAGIQALRLGAEAWGGFKTENPRAARNLEGVVNIGAFFTPVKGVSAAGVTKKVGEVGVKAAAEVGKDVAMYPVKGVKTVVSGVRAATIAETEDAVSALRRSANQHYTAMKKEGANINPEKTQKLFKGIDSQMAKRGILNKALHGKTMAVVEDLKNSAAEGTLTLETLDQQRRLLSRIKPGLEGGEDAGMARAAVRVMNAFEKRLTGKDLVEGTEEAVTQLHLGRAAAHKGFKLDKIADILKQADGDPNRIKAGLKRFVNKDKNLRGFSAEEKSFLRMAASATTAEKLLKMGGKFGIDLGTSLTPGNTVAPLLGGYFGGTPIIAAGTAVRQLQKYMARGKAEQVLKVLQKGGNPKELKRLPKRQAQKIKDAVIKQSEPEA